MSNVGQVEAINFSALAYIDFLSSHRGMSVDDLIIENIIDGDDLQKRELASLANPSNSLRSWELLESSMNSTSGMKAAAFEKNGQIVFTFRGTEPAPQFTLIDMVRDIYTDLQLALPDAPLGEPNQFRDAYNFVKSTIESVTGYSMTNAQLASYVQTHNIEFVGHSLGGALVQYVIAELGAGHGTTFNAVGIGQVLDIADTSVFDNMITDYVNADDLVGNFGEQLGTTVYLQGTQSWTSIDKQAIAQLYAIIASLLSGAVPPLEGALAAQDLLKSMNTETFNYIAEGWIGSHDLSKLMSSPNALSAGAPTSANNVGQIINSVTDVAAAASEGVDMNVLAGVGQILLGVANAQDALNDFEDGVMSTLDDAKTDISTQVGTIVDEAITDIRDRFGSIVNDAVIVQTEVGTMVADINTRIANVLATKNQELVQSFLLGQEGFYDLFEATNPIQAAIDIAARVARGENIFSAIYAEFQSNIGQGIDGVEDILESISGIASAVATGISDVTAAIYEEAADHLSRILPAVGDMIGSAVDAGVIFSAATVEVLGVLSVQLLDFGVDLLTATAQFVTDFDGAMTNLFDGLGHLVTAVDKIVTESFFAFLRGDITILDGMNAIFNILSGKAFAPLDPNSAIFGTIGDDTIYGYSGSNLIDGSNGNDVIYGGAGHDTIMGGRGSDTLYGGTGDDILFGGDDRNWESFLVPEHAPDILDGGAGNDLLEGGGGNDTYIFGKGYGHDIIIDQAFDIIGSLYAGFDTLKFQSDVSPSDVAVRRLDYGLEFKIISTGETIIDQTFSFAGSYYNYGGIDQVEFANGVIWDKATLLDKARYVYGTSGDDAIGGYYGQDNIIHAGAGDDTVNGASGADTLYGEAGNDVLEGQSGTDTLDGGAGNDILRGGADDDIYVFGRGYGHDTIIDEVPYSGSPWANYNGGFDSIYFKPDIAAEDLEIYRVGMYDLEFRVRGTNDILTVKNHYASTNNSIESAAFGNGNDPVWSKADIEARAVNTIGTDSSEVLYGTEADNHITGGAEGDQLYGYGGNDTLDGGSEDDYLVGGTGNDTYIFGLGYGVDTIFDSDAAPNNIDTVRFLAGINPSSIEITRNGDNVELAITGTNDKLILERYFSAYNTSNAYVGEDAHKVERFEFANGTVWTTDNIEDVLRVINGTANDDSINGHYDLANIITSGDGNDTVYGGALGDQIDTGAGDDTVYGGDGADVISGGAGNDSLYGELGNDTLDGGTGNDLLEGGSGNDTYLFGIGYGSDTIYDSDATEGNQDKIRFLAGISPDDIRVTRTGEDLTLSIIGTSDTLTVEKYFSEYSRAYGWYATHVGANGNKIETIEFANGTIWSIADVKDKARHISGTASDDYINGFSDQQNIISAGDGNDTVYAAHQGDTLRGEAGNDMLYGGQGNDVLVGGAGDDVLEGGTGNDIYEFTLGFGTDTIYDSDTTEGNVDTIAFLGSIAPEDVIVTRNGENLELTIVGNADKLIVEKYFSEYARSYGWSSYYVGANGNKIERITFTDGTVWTVDTIKDIVRHINGTEGDDYLQGLGDQHNIIDGGAGNDTIYAGGLGDEMSGGAGNDSLYGAYGDDTLDGGTGDDLLEGNYGNDTYLFNLGSGNDTIYDSDATEGNQDKIIFGNAIAKEDVTIQRSGNDLVFTFAGSTDTLTIEKYFSQYGRSSGWSSPNVGINGNKVEQIHFADGTIWDNETVIEKVSHILGTANADTLTGVEGQQSKLSGLDGDDTLNAASYGDILDGGAGNDTLNGSYGQDVLRGGTGNDTLIGGAGSDTYVFGLGDGHDTIYDGDHSFAMDTISFAEDIEPSDVEVSREGNNFIIKINGGTNDSITIEDYFSPTVRGAGYETGMGVNKVERIMFADGTVWDTASLEDQFRCITGTSGDDTLGGYETDDIITAQEGNDVIHAGTGNDTVDAGAGNDTVYGEAGHDQLTGGAGNDILDGGIGNDTLIGGTGNDTLIGGEGSDTYVFSLGDGEDEIHDFSTNANEVDVIAFQSGISPEDVTVQRDGDDLVLAITNTTDSLTIKNYFSAYRDGDATEYTVGVNKIEQVTFANGMTWNNRTLEYAVNNGGVVDPNITFGTAQSEGLYADQDGQTIYADEGDDTVMGGEGDDVLYGEAGNDTIYGGQGNDVLVGGAGNDYLDGGVGDDIYRFSPGFGHDTIVDYDTTEGNVDTVAFSSEIIPDDVTLSRVGNNLVLSLSTGDSITIQSYFAGAVGGHRKIEQVTFTNGTTWDTAYLETAVPPTSTYDNTVTGTENDDYLYGTTGNDAITGGAGNDTIYSDNGTYDGTGNDLLDGGTGNDTLYGAGGDDTYVFGLGYGQDYILDEARAGGSYYGAYIDAGFDTIKILPGISPEDIIVRRSGSDLVLEIAGTTDTMTIGAFFREIEGVLTSGIERVEFSDSSNTVWTLQDLVYKARNIEGTSSDETLSGYEGQDNIITAGAGNDTLYGASGNDTLDGGTGNDRLEGGYGNDTYVFGIGYGVDTIYDSDSTENNQDTIQFLEGIAPQDVLVKRSGDNLELSISGTDDRLIVERYFSQYNRNGYYAGSEDANKIEQIRFADNTVWSTSDVKDKARYIDGTNGDDYISGFGDQQNIITAGDGNDTIYAGSLGDQLNGGAGNDNLYGSSGNDTLIGGVGNDILEGSTGDDTYVFAAGFGSDTIYDLDSTEGNLDTIRFLEGINPADVTATRSSDDLVLSVASTSDTLTVSRYFSQYSRNGYYAGSPDAQKVEVIEFANGTTWSISDIKDKVRHMSGTNGDDYISGFSDQQNIIAAGDGNDTVYAGSLGDQIDGGAGSDTLYGSSGNDTLIGGTGNDTLEGNYGNDTYVFGLGFGSDVIYDIDSTEGNVDTIQFLAGIAPEDVIATRSGDDLVLTVSGTSDVLTVSRYFSQYTRNGYYAGSADAQKVELIEFANGTVWSIADIKDKVRYISGTENADIIYGFSDQQNIVTAGAGDDTVYAGGANGDELRGEAGNDSLYGAHGNEILDGGTGDDILEGSSGNDTYVFGLGYGVDTIYDNDTTEGNQDTIQFLAGITPEDVFVKRVGNNLELLISNTTDKLVVQNYFSDYHRNSSYYAGVNANKVELVTFANGTTWNMAAVLDKARYMTGTEDGDTISAFDTNDVITALAGDDTVYAGHGDDVVHGGDGNDTLYGESGNDHLLGNAGDDTLYGADGNDTLNGGTGNDLLEGSTGDDTYVFGLGYGQDTIYDNDTTQGNKDIVTFLEGINPNDVSVLRNGDNLELRIANTDDVLIVERYFSPYARNSWYTYDYSMNKIEEFHFSDDTIWDVATILNKARYINGTSGDDSISGYGDQQNIIHAGAGNDTVYASSYAGDELYGEGGNDTLYGSSNADILDGGTGNDLLEGSTGNDTYIFGLGYGTDTIYDNDTTQGNTDKVLLQAGINPEDVKVTRNGDNLELRIDGTSDMLIIERYFSPYARNSWYTYDYNMNKVEQIVFDNGTIWDVAAILDKARYVNGTESADTIYGFSDQQNIIAAGAGDDTVYLASQGDRVDAGAGNDSVYGSSGNDHITGGTGDDYLEGNTGNDTYVFAPGFGTDTIYDNDSGQGNSFDVVEFAAGIAPEDVKVRRLSNGDLELTVTGTTDKLTIQRYFSNYYKDSSWNTGADSNAIEEFRFADATVWTIADIKDKARYITGSENGETISAFDTNDVITALAGDDTVYAGYGDDVVHGGDGNDTVHGESGNDTLSGNAGNDNLYGADGNDLLDGGTGNDYLEGSTGDDTYVFGIGYGQDVIYDNDYGQGGSVDKVTFLEGIDPDDVSAKRLSNGDLELTIAGTSDKLTIQRYFSPYYKDSSWNTGADSNVVEEFHFADETVWTTATIKDKVRTMHGTENSDTLQGFGDQLNFLYAGAGDDTVYAGGINGDELYGEAGNDTLIGSGASETLDGGIGNDHLEGSTGNDTYVFGLGYGQDTIYDNDNGQTGGLDKVAFLAGINPEDITAKRLQNSDLELTFAGTSDKLTIERYFSPYYKNSSWHTGTNSNVIEEFHFADNTVWDIDDIKTIVRTISGTEGNDTIYGYEDADTITAGAGDDAVYAGAGNDVIIGGIGNDALYGEDGNDTLEGGAGNDSLNGGYNDDIYVFSGAFGNDQINDYHGNDLVRFDDLGMDSLIFEQNGNALRITPDGTTDSVSVDYWYQYNDYKIETVQDASGNTITSSQIEQLIQAMASWSANNNGMSWSQALSSNPQDVQSIVSQYWTAPTV